MTSIPTTYIVHRDTQHNVGEVTAYLAEVHRPILQAASGRELDYFGIDLGKAPRAWSDDERNTAFNSEATIAAFDTPELAINPVEVARAVERCIDSHPLIESRLGRNVLRVDRDGNTVRVASVGRDGVSEENFDHVVNALWDGPFAVDRTMGLMPERPWLHRLNTV